MSEDTGSESGSNAPAVSAATPLYPVALAYNLDLGQLAAAPAMRSCFLCTQVRMEPMKVAVFAKQLCEQTIFTVGDYLGTDHATVNAKVLSLKCVSTLDGYLKQFAGLPENRHAALEEPDDTMSTVALRRAMPQSEWSGGVMSMDPFPRGRRRRCWNTCTVRHVISTTGCEQLLQARQARPWRASTLLRPSPVPCGH